MRWRNEGERMFDYDGQSAYIPDESNFMPLHNVQEVISKGTLGDAMGWAY